MELVNVEINNYRSIEKLKLDFEKNTKVFIGVSETGKSNLLKALNVISPNYGFEKKDIRENISYDSHCEINYLIRLSNDEKKELITTLKDYFPYLDLEKTFICSKNYVDITYFLNNCFIYNINIEDEERNIKSIFDWKELKINSNIRLLSANENSPLTIINKSDNSEVVITETNYVSLENFSFSDELGENISSEKILNDIEEIANKYIIENFNLKVLYWNYSENNLLPPEIKTEEFVANPDICLPLKKIFELAGKEHIKEEYDRCQQRGRKSSWKNVLEDVNKKINKYIKGKWPAIPDNTKILLNQNGEYITIEIKDTNNGYEMVDRSDGYKRLMTFLIMISIDNKLSKLKDSLILIDSPDLEIDIPSQKYLKNELIEIGKNNYVFYSTHSPYMIDNDNIERHYIVTKKSETTKIEQAEQSKAYDNAIILNALGTTLFEDVNNINIAFEGFTDKKLFDCGKSLLSKKSLEIINQVGRCQFGGLKNLNAFVGIWELVCKSKKCIVCIDGDEKAKEKEKSYLNNSLIDVCEIISYSKYISERKVETAEDFLTSEYIKQVCDNFSKKYNNNILIQKEKLDDDSKVKMDIINAWLGKFHFKSSDNSLNQKRSELKRLLFENITTKDIREDYTEFLTKFINNHLN